MATGPLKRGILWALLTESGVLHMRTDWYWIRQGALLQDPGRYAGRMDLPTLPPDAPTARRLRARLPNGAVWLTSPLARARQTVAVLDPAANAVTVDEVSDQDLGQWAGRRRTEVHKTNPQIEWTQPASIEPEGGEAFPEVVNRTAAVIERLTQHYPDRPLVVVTHAAIIRAALVLALDLPVEAGFQFECSPFSLTHLSWTGPSDFDGASEERIGTWHVHHLNLTVN